MSNFTRTECHHEVLREVGVEFLGDNLRVTREAGYQRKMLGEIDLRLTEKEGARIPNKCSREIGIVLPPKECVAAHQQLPPADNIGNAG